MPVSKQGRKARVMKTNPTDRARRTVRLDTSRLLNPARQQVIFDIVPTCDSVRNSGRSSGPIREQSYDEGLEDNNSRAIPTLRSSDRMPETANVRNTRVPESYSNSGQHGADTLYVRRTKARHRRAWTRKRNENAYRRLTVLRGQCSPKSQCLLSCLLFIVILTTYLLLSFNTDLATPLQVILIILLLISAVLFFHGVLRTWIARRLPRFLERQPHLSSRGSRLRHRGGRRNRPVYVEPDSAFDLLPMDDSLYTPTTPVRVHLFRDEEELVGEKEPSITVETYLNSPEALEADKTHGMPTPPPPAYGLWRCSVKADPSLLHWSRCDLDGSYGETVSHELRSTSAVTETGQMTQPPSYNNDDRHSNVPSPETLEVGNGAFIQRQDNNLESAGRNSGVVLTEEDWPLQENNDAVQEVTRRLLEDQRRHTIL